ncbi:MAG: ribonuclease D [Myxococcales bacterium]|nr:ribonuclease D [Myxococcales bacterium]
MEPAPTRWIRTADQLDALVDELAGYRAIGIDTEADSLHHYTEKVCLIQLTAFGGASWLVDPLALRDLSPLGPILSDPAVLKVVHGGDNDVTSMRRDFGFSFRTMFDTSIAARLLGDTEVGLQALVRNLLGVELSKGSQRDDWSKRPLTPKQEAYALADVEHLMALAANLTERLATAGRTAWAREEFAALASLPPAEKRTGPDEFRRIKGSAKLPRRQQAVLRELYQWREARAAAADRPPFKIVSAELLLAMAEQVPTTVDDVARALSSHPREAIHAEIVFAAITRGLGLPESEWPAREHSDRPMLSASTRRRVEALRTWRDEQAKRSRLDPSIIMSQRLIERIALAGPQTLAALAAVEGVRQWRVTEWGPALLDACAGKGV